MIRSLGGFLILRAILAIAGFILLWLLLNALIGLLNDLRSSLGLGWYSLSIQRVA
jgi:hypothetical protein